MPGVILVTSSAVPPTHTGTPIVGARDQEPLPDYVAESGLMSTPAGSCLTGQTIAGLFRRAATYVDKILKGAQPAEIPVEQPKEFEFIINLESRQADRPDDSAERAGASGPVIK